MFSSGYDLAARWIATTNPVSLADAFHLHCGGGGGEDPNSESSEQNQLEFDLRHHQECNSGLVSNEDRMTSGVSGTGADSGGGGGAATSGGGATDATAGGGGGDMQQQMEHQHQGWNSPIYQKSYIDNMIMAWKASFICHQKHPNRTRNKKQEAKGSFIRSFFVPSELPAESGYSTFL
jgi:hypothetical protein